MVLNQNPAYQKKHPSRCLRKVNLPWVNKFRHPPNPDFECSDPNLAKKQITAPDFQGSSVMESCWDHCWVLDSLEPEVLKQEGPGPFAGVPVVVRAVVADGLPEAFVVFVPHAVRVCTEPKGFLFIEA